MSTNIQEQIETSGDANMRPAELKRITKEGRVKLKEENSVCIQKL